MKNNGNSYIILSLPAILLVGVAVGISYKLDSMGKKILALESSLQNTSEKAKKHEELLAEYETEKEKLGKKAKKHKKLLSEYKTEKEGLQTEVNSIKEKQQTQLQLATLQEEKLQTTISSLNIQLKLAISHNNQTQKENIQKLTLHFEEKLEFIFQHLLYLGLDQIATQAELTKADHDEYMAMKYHRLFEARELLKKLNMKGPLKIISGYLNIMKSDVDMELVEEIRRSSNVDFFPNCLAIDYEGPNYDLPDDQYITEIDYSTPLVGTT